MHQHTSDVVVTGPAPHSALPLCTRWRSVPRKKHLLPWFLGSASRLVLGSPGPKAPSSDDTCSDRGCCFSTPRASCLPAALLVPCGASLFQAGKSMVSACRPRQQLLHPVPGVLGPRMLLKQGSCWLIPVCALHAQGFAVRVSRHAGPFVRVCAASMNIMGLRIVGGATGEGGYLGVVFLKGCSMHPSQMGLHCGCLRGGGGAGGSAQNCRLP